MLIYKTSDYVALTSTLNTVIINVYYYIERGGCLRTVDLFAGCGGLSLGFIHAEFDIIGAFENWDAALDIYNANFQHRANKCDLSNIDKAIPIISQLKPQVIIGGPPCQDFSIAGKHKEGERADLTVAYAKIIASIKPEYFVMENVAGALKSCKYQEAVTIMKQAGYGITETILTASLCGVPQKRKRLFCIGHIKDVDNFLSSNLAARQQVIPTTVREYFDEIHYPYTFEYYYCHPRTYGRRAIYSIDEAAPTIRGCNRPKPPEYKRHVNDKTDPELVVCLTTNERALIQTFPDTFRFEGISSIVEQIIGNAVPVKLAEYVAQCLNRYRNGIIDHKALFVDWLQKEKKYTPRAAGDVLSRVNRANRIYPLDKPFIPNDYISQLIENDEYVNMSVNVQSQIKRAIKLYSEYRNQ